jgi:hypothetical protein
MLTVTAWFVSKVLWKEPQDDQTVAASCLGDTPNNARTYCPA